MLPLLARRVLVACLALLARPGAAGAAMLLLLASRAPITRLALLARLRAAGAAMLPVFACLALLAWPGAAAAEVPVAVAASVAAEGARTRLAFTLSAPVQARAWVLERPDRVVLDLGEVAFKLPPGAGRRREGLVAGFRTGLFAPGRSRVVVDLAGPALVAALATARRESDGATLLTVDLAPAPRERFRQAAAEEAGRGAPPQAAPSPHAAPPPAPAERRPLIVVDPGHGGGDPGARTASGALEKDLAFGFAQAFKAGLEATGRYRVQLTRDGDVFVPLRERVRIARAAGADLMISVHADSISAAPHVRGLTVYTGSEQASDQESARLAEAENRADATHGAEAGPGLEEVADILQDLTLRETRGLSHRFAAGAVRELGAVARLNGNPLRQAGFRVLRAVDVPSVLIELGYLSSGADIALLTSVAWRERTAAALTAAIDRYFEARVAGRGQGAAPGDVTGSIAPVSP